MPVKDWSVIERKRKTEKSCLKQLDWEEERVFYWLLALYNVSINSHLKIIKLKELTSKLNLK